MKILKCSLCGAYTLHEKCPKCGGSTVIARPPKYSPDDKYASYRRKWKREMKIM